MIITMMTDVIALQVNLSLLKKTKKKKKQSRDDDKCELDAVAFISRSRHLRTLLFDELCFSRQSIPSLALSPA